MAAGPPLKKLGILLLAPQITPKIHGSAWRHLYVVQVAKTESDDRVAEKAVGVQAVKMAAGQALKHLRLILPLAPQTMYRTYRTA
jgi:hypothetical protein